MGQCPHSQSAPSQSLFTCIGRNKTQMCALPPLEGKTITIWRALLVYGSLSRRLRKRGREIIRAREMNIYIYIYIYIYLYTRHTCALKRALSVFPCFSKIKIFRMAHYLLPYYLAGFKVASHGIPGLGSNALWALPHNPQGSPNVFLGYLRRHPALCLHIVIAVRPPKFRHRYYTPPRQGK